MPVRLFVTKTNEILSIDKLRILELLSHHWYRTIYTWDCKTPRSFYGLLLYPLFPSKCPWYRFILGYPRLMQRHLRQDPSSWLSEIDVMHIFISYTVGMVRASVSKSESSFRVSWQEQEQGRLNHPHILFYILKRVGKILCIYCGDHGFIVL
jgi:uncharacterized Zn-finger protein